jgi:hypothetical protein
MRKGIVFAVVLLVVQIPLLALTLIQSDVFGGPSRDNARRIAFAPDGGVYVAGTTLSADGDTDAFLRKYDANRLVQWEHAYGLPFDTINGFDDDFIEGLAVGSDGSAYLAGMLGTGVLFLAGFDDAGNLMWDSTYGENATIASGAAVGPDGHIYVSAHFGGSNTSDPTHLESRLLKFDASGNLVWARAWGGSGAAGVPGFDQSHGVATSSDGVYMAGDTNSFFANDAYLVKFDFDGNLLWQRDWGVDGVDAPFTGLTTALGVTTDAEGNAYFTGNTSDSGHLKNTVLVKFSGSGDLIWSKVGGPGFGTGRDVAVSPDGTAVFVSGNIFVEERDVFGGLAFVAEFTSEGKAKRANSWGSTNPELGASAESVVVNGDGLVVTAGFVGPAPHVFDRASNSAKNADTHLIFPTGVVQELPALLEAQDGQLLPFDSTSLGDTDGFTLWTQR